MNLTRKYEATLALNENPYQPRVETPLKSKLNIAAKLGLEDNPKWQRAKDLGNRFLYSDFYLAAIMLIVFISWVSFGEMVGLILIILAASAIMFLKDDITPLIPLIFMVAMLFPREVNPASYGYALLSFIPMPIAIVYHLIRFRRKFIMGRQFLPQLAVSIALIMGGVGITSGSDYMRGLAFLLLLGVAILVLYFIFYNYCAPKDNVDLKKYLSKTMVYAALIICLQVLVHYIRVPEQLFNYGDKVSLGWCIGNNFATIMLLLLPGTCYLAVKSRFSWAYTLFGIAQYAAIILSWSRGAILFGFIILPFLLAYMIFASKSNRKGIILAVGATVLILAVLIGVYWKDFSAFATRIINNSWTSDGALQVSGRDDLYREAWQAFLSNPVFGVGLGFRGKYFTIVEVMPMYWFHSTLFQVIGSLGLVGIAAYVYSYVVRYKIIIKKDMFNIIVFICMLAFEGYSMIDTGTFIPMPTMIMVMLITMVLEITNAQGRRELYA